MRFALLQTGPNKPSLQQLKRAFRVLPDMLELDLNATSFKDAYGIIMRGLDEPSAELLKDSLQHEDVSVRVVPETELPTIPLGRAVRTLRFTPSHFEAIDPLERVSTVPWNQVIFVAAGHIGRSPLETGRAASTDLETEGRQNEHGHLWADILLQDGEHRFSIDADQFDFGYLQQRLTDQPTHNLAYLVQDLTQFAPHAGQNRGAFQFCERPESPVSYPGKGAYVDELIWMLWLAKNVEGTGT